MVASRPRGTTAARRRQSTRTPAARIPEDEALEEDEEQEEPSRSLRSGRGRRSLAAPEVEQPVLSSGRTPRVAGRRGSRLA